MLDGEFSTKVHMSAPHCVDYSFALVIPAFNRAQLICATIESALQQSKPFSEIIVVDDGSTDNTAAVLDRYKDTVTYIRTENRGVQAARNLGVRTAKSDYVTLCDSDDLLEPDFLQVFSRWLSTHASCDMLYCNFVSFNNMRQFGDRLSEAPLGLYDGLENDGGFLVGIPDLIYRIVQFQILFVSGMTMRRSQFDVIGEYDIQFNGVGAEDFEFTLRAVSRASVAFCTQSLVRVRRHAGNDSADQARHVRGEIKILEHALNIDTQLTKYRKLVHHAIDERRERVFSSAFAKGDFELAAQILTAFRKLPDHFHFRVKKYIVELPSLLRKILWRLTQV